MGEEQVAVALITASTAATAGGFAALFGAALAWFALRLTHGGRASLHVGTVDPLEAPGLRQALRRAGRIRLVRASGPLLFLSAGRIDRIIPESPPWPSYLVIDMRGVTMLDGSALSALGHVLDCLETRDGRFALVCTPGSSVLRTLEAAGLMRRALGSAACFTTDQAFERIAAQHPEAPRASQPPLRLVSTALQS